MTNRWYYEILGHHVVDVDSDMIDLTSPGVTDVNLYDADYFDREGYLQDRDVAGDLPLDLQAVLSEEEESRFVFKGSESEFVLLMEENGIKPLPVGD